MPVSELRALADAYGVLPTYVDMNGQVASASEEALTAVLAALGADLEGGWSAALAARRETRVGPGLPPLVVLRAGEPGLVPWNGPQPHEREALLVLDGGAPTTLDLLWAPAPLAAEVGSDPPVALSLPPLPAGMYTLMVGDRACRLLCAPSGCFRGDGRRKLGIFIPHHAIHDAQTLGLGDFRSLRLLGGWAAELGATVLGTLPLLPAFLGTSPYEPSPYAPVSRRFWAEHLIDPRETLEWPHCPGARQILADAEPRLAELRRGDWNRPAETWALLRAILAALADYAWSHDPATLRDWANEDPERLIYARFRAATERWGPWPTWWGGARAGEIAPLPPETEADVQMWVYAQREAERQLRFLRDTLEARGAELYLDLPIGVHPDGFDAWRHQAVFARGCSAGAPPDPYFPSGQDWGFPPLSPEASRATGHDLVRQCLEAHLAMAHRLRIDHVMGLYRLYWVSPAHGARDGVYVRYPAEEWFALLCLLSQRYRCAVVGENLGMVPPEVDRALAERDIAGIHVGIFSMDPGRPGGIRPPRAGDVTSLDTHDTPTFAGWWEGLDLVDHVALGWMDARRATAERRGRAVCAGGVAGASTQSPVVWPDAPFPVVVAAGLTRGLAAGEAGLVLVNLEDLWGETRPHNVPGTWRELPNWLRRSARSLEAMFADPAVFSQLSAFAEARAR